MIRSYSFDVVKLVERFLVHVTTKILHTARADASMRLEMTMLRDYHLEGICNELP